MLMDLAGNIRMRVEIRAGLRKGEPRTQLIDQYQGHFGVHMIYVSMSMHQLNLGVVGEGQESCNGILSESRLWRGQIRDGSGRG